VFCINKMDLVDFDEAVFTRIQKELEDFSSKLEVRDIRYIPISALKGDNVVDRSKRMDWYQGPTLMYLLENIHIAGDLNHIDRRFPVQYVVRPMTDAWHDFRGFAGRVTGGVFRKGEPVQVLPSGFQSTIKSIHLGEQELEEAFAPQSVVITLTDEIDVSRGDMLVSPNNMPETGQDIDVMLCWFNERPLQPGGKYAIKHTTRDARCMVKEVKYQDGHQYAPQGGGRSHHTHERHRACASAHHRALALRQVPAQPELRQRDPHR
jgi:sulfate adenylyltransferase subunit 1